MDVGIIGLGLIGGSLAKDLNTQIAISVIGYDINENHRLMAHELKLCEVVDNLDLLFSKSQIIILAIPVDKIEAQIVDILDNMREDQIVIDMGSTKANICKKVSTHKNRSRFVACHPLAGTEFSGPTAALKNLFYDKKMIICESEKSNSYALKITVEILLSLGSNIVYMNADEHDMHMAYVSHLSHISSFVLGSTVLEIEKDEKQILNLAGTGFASTVRLAKSHPSTWTSIFLANKDHLLTAIEHYINELNMLKKHIECQDHASIYQYIEKANLIRKIVPQ